MRDMRKHKSKAAEEARVQILGSLECQADEFEHGPED